MKFDCGETWDEYVARLGSWRKWFAWYPVRINDHDCRWLEYVERRCEFLYTIPPRRIYYYRVINLE